MKELLFSLESRTHHGMSIYTRIAFSAAACHRSIVLHHVIPLHLARGWTGLIPQSAETLECTGVCLKRWSHERYDRLRRVATSCRN